MIITMPEADDKSKLNVSVFIDGSNIYFAQKKMGKWLDWVKVKHFLEKQYQVVEFRYYVGLRKCDNKMNKFLLKLKKIGFILMTKPVKHLIDEQGHYTEKANFDVEITADILISLPEISAVILFSGDSDFTYLINIIHKKRKKMFVFSSRKTIAYELKLNADKYVLLENIPNLTKIKRFVKL